MERRRVFPYLTVRLNLWLFGGNAPSDGRSVEVIVESFGFAPA